MLSGFKAAIVLGVTSANIIIIRVIQIVTARTPLSPQSLIAIIVARTEARMFTKLLPINMTPRSLSVLSKSLETLLADLFLCLTKCWSLYLLIAIMLVSELEKNAETSTKIKILVNKIQRGTSFNLVQDYRLLWSRNFSRT